MDIEKNPPQKTLFQFNGQQVKSITMVTQFKPSDYGSFQNRIYDENVRKCQEAMVKIEGVEKITHQILKNYLKADPSDDYQWRMLKYENGHFFEHSDRERPRFGYEHFGTQVLLPPQSINQYKGGQLKIKCQLIKMDILPDKTQWTHIILPLGVLHQVSNVEGVRISFTKSIYIKKIKQMRFDRRNIRPGCVD